jgi:hypothetical protein
MRPAARILLVLRSAAACHCRSSGQHPLEGGDAHEELLLVGRERSHARVELAGEPLKLFQSSLRPCSD